MAPYNPPNAHYAHINMKTANENLINTVVGYKGKGLYSLTKKAGLQYMWFNYETKILELWGPYKALKNGSMDTILKLIDNMEDDLELNEFMELS